MPRLKRETREQDKQKILEYLKDQKEAKTTFNISSFLKRHHGYTNTLLMELKKEKKVNLLVVNNICAWSFKPLQTVKKEVFN